MKVEERQIYHEKWDQRRKVRWMRPHKMQDSSLNELCQERADICRCLPPDTTWHKVKSPKAD